MLKKASSFVLASLKASTYGKEYASAFRSLRPRWQAFLTILRSIKFPDKLFLPALLAWYVAFWVALSFSPVDGQNWILASILPGILVTVLVATHRAFPLSHGSYALIALFLTLHLIGAHYTYAQTPFGLWLEHAFAMSRNPFDRVVHFCFGLLLTYPLLEVFVRLAGAGGALASYLSVMTPLGLSGLWEVLESWVARLVSPQLGDAYLGSQGDVWDAQKDMGAAVLGSLLCLLLIAAASGLRRRMA
jgi:putative membrane protein